MRYIVYFFWIVLLPFTGCKNKCKAKEKFITKDPLIIAIKEMKLQDLELENISNTIILINDSASFVTHVKNQPVLLEKEFNGFSYILVARGDDLFGCLINSYVLELVINPADYVLNITPCFRGVCFPKRPNHLFVLIKTYKLSNKFISSEVKK